MCRCGYICVWMWLGRSIHRSTVRNSWNASMTTPAQSIRIRHTANNKQSSPIQTFVSIIAKMLIVDILLFFTYLLICIAVRSSQSSMVSTNPFESDVEDENEDVNAMRSANGGSTSTLSKAAQRKKRRAPAPPTPVSIPPQKIIRVYVIKIVLYFLDCMCTYLLFT